MITRQERAQLLDVIGEIEDSLLRLRPTDDASKRRYTDARYALDEMVDDLTDWSTAPADVIRP